MHYRQAEWTAYYDRVRSAEGPAFSRVAWASAKRVSFTRACLLFLLPHLCAHRSTAEGLGSITRHFNRRHACVFQGFARRVCDLIMPAQITRVMERDIITGDWSTDSTEIFPRLTN